MNDALKKIIVLIAACGIFGAGYHFYRNHNTVIVPQIKTADEVKNIVPDISNDQAKEIAEKIPLAKPAGTVKTTAGSLQKVAKKQQAAAGSDAAPVVSDTDIEKLPKDTAVEVQQYHIYTAPKVLREIGAKVDEQNYVSGVSYGVKRRINEKGKYIGVRADYNWNEKKVGVWLTYTY